MQLTDSFAIIVSSISLLAVLGILIVLTTVCFALSATKLFLTILKMIQANCAAIVELIRLIKAELKQKNKAKDREDTEMEEEEISEKANSDLSSKIVKLEEEIKTKDNDIQNLEQRLQDEKNNVIAIFEDINSSNSASTTSSIKRALLLVDAVNKDSIEKHMQNSGDVQWEVLGVPDSKTALQIVGNKKRVQNFQCVVIVVGAQEMIMNKIQSETVFKNLKKCSEILTSYRHDFHVVLCETLPIDVKVGTSRVMNFNFRVSKLESEKEHSIIRLQALIEHPKSKTVQGDSIILTDFGAEHCASILKSKTVVPDPVDIISDDSSDDEEEEVIIVVKVASHRMKFVIGTNGTTVQDIQSKSGADINKMNWVEDGTKFCGFMIKGLKHDVKKAKAEITRIANSSDIDSMVNETTSQGPARKANQKRGICRYFLQGKCSSGSYCNFLHTSDSNVKKAKSK